MEIRIDTLRDSKEHIREAIAFLQRFVDSSASRPRDVFSGDNPATPASGVFGMFGDDAPSSPPSSLELPEDDEDKVEIVPY